MIKQVIHGVFLDDLPLLHHNDPVTALVDDVEIVGDEEVAQVYSRRRRMSRSRIWS